MFFLIRSSRAPFDWRIPSGYLFFFWFEFITIYYSIMYCAIFVCYPFGTCCFMTAFADDIKMEVIKLNKIHEKEKTAVELYERLCRIVDFHAAVKQLSLKVQIQFWIKSASSKFILVDLFRSSTIFINFRWQSTSLGPLQP